MSKDLKATTVISDETGAEGTFFLIMGFIFIQYSSLPNNCPFVAGTSQFDDFFYLHSNAIVIQSRQNFCLL